ncbi:hypothetical protein QQ045_011530 [Rhodiola kirilowii]
MACCGLWGIWSMRNKSRHDEEVTPLWTHLWRWADLISMSIPYHYKPSMEMDLALQNLYTRYHPKGLSSRRWFIWKPGLQGATLTLAQNYIHPKCHGGAILRNHSGSFLGAFGEVFSSSADIKELLHFALSAMTALNAGSWTECHLHSSHPQMHSLVGPPSHIPWDLIYAYRRLKSTAPLVTFKHLLAV